MAASWRHGAEAEVSGWFEGGIEVLATEITALRAPDREPQEPQGSRDRSRVADSGSSRHRVALASEQPCQNRARHKGGGDGGQGPPAPGHIGPEGFGRHCRIAGTDQLCLDQRGQLRAEAGQNPGRQQQVAQHRLRATCWRM